MKIGIAGIDQVKLANKAKVGIAGELRGRSKFAIAGLSQTANIETANSLLHRDKHLVKKDGHRLTHYH